MVTTEPNSPANEFQIIELVGLPGSGKTTLSKLLSERDEIFLVNKIPYFRDPKFFFFFLWNSILMFPDIVRILTGSRKWLITMREIVWMEVLKGWYVILQEQANHSKKILLDEGPFFYMAFLKFYGSEALHNPGVQSWWSEVYGHWAKTLDMIIFLDANNQTLCNRIRERDQSHQIKDLSDDQAFELLSRYREVMNTTIKELTSRSPGLSIFRLDTSAVSMEQLCEQIEKISRMSKKNRILQPY